MVLIKDFWKVWGEYKNAFHYEREMSEVVLEHPGYISAYASAKQQLVLVENDLEEVVTSLKLEGLFTEDMKAMLDPQPLGLIYPDENMIAEFWNNSPSSERLILLLRLGIMKGLAENYIEMIYEVLPKGFREKMEGIHDE